MKKLFFILFALAFTVSPVFAQKKSKSTTKTTQQIYSELAESVVVIKVKEKQYVTTDFVQKVATSDGLGSGVLVSAEGYILTASHVVNNAEEIKVIFKNGEKIPAKIVRDAKLADVALIKLMWLPKEMKVAPIGNSDEVEIGEDVVVIGAPYGLDYSVSKGIISRKVDNLGENIPMFPIQYFQTDAAINRGNSGGPMFNMNGEVIGIVSHILSESGGFEGLGMAATSNVAKYALIEQKSKWLGFNVSPLTPQMAAILNLPQDAGLVVENIVDGSPADIIGLKRSTFPCMIAGEALMLGGDIILAVNGITVQQDMESLGKIKEALNNTEPGQTFVFKVLRHGKIIELTGVMPQ